MADIEMHQPVQQEQQDNAPVPDAAAAEERGFIRAVISKIPLGERTLNAAAWTYDVVKHSNPQVENACNGVEERVNRTYENVVVRPVEAVAGAYSSGVENAKWAVATTANGAKQVGILGVGTGVLATQLGLQLVTGGAGLVLDGVGAAQRGGRRMVTSAQAAQRVVEAKIWVAVEEGIRIGKIPLEKATEFSHAFLDIARALMERGLAIEMGDETNLTLKERITNMAKLVANALHDKAHDHVIEPLNGQARVFVEQISKSFVLVDLVRARGNWAMEQVQELSSSVADLKARLETEALEYGTQPEAALMRYIQSNANQLREQLQSLKEKGQQVYGEETHVDGAITYLQEFETQLGESEDIYQVSDKILAEARVRIADLSGWTAGLLRRQPQQQQPPQQDA